MSKKIASKKSSAKKIVRGWQPLRKGDVVDIIAPASSCSREGLAKGLEFLKGWGLVPRMPEPLFADDVICSNTDEMRFKYLKNALLAKDSRAVWCVRGGYGSNRLIEELMKVKKPAQPKLFIGFSDITTLHVFLNEQWGWPTIHGPMIDRIGRGLIAEDHLAELHELFFGEVPQITYDGLKPLNQAARKAKTLRGPVTGGNAMTLQSAIGTKAPWITDGRIIFLEEVDERGYRTDRILEHLRQTGHFDRALAVVLGDFTGGDEADGTNRNPAVIERFASQLKIPVMAGVPAGHGTNQRPVPFETSAVLTTGEGGSITIESGADFGGDGEPARAVKASAKRSVKKARK